MNTTKPMTRQRAWAQLVLKAVDEKLRVLEGMATTPTPDRLGDVVESDGATFKLPLPFLWQHDSSQPIGSVTAAKVTKDGIPVRIQLATTDEPGTLKARLDEAWQSIKMQLVRGLSIGFSPTEYSYMEDTGGYRFIRWEWLELSAVTIPANVEASIATIKSYGTKSPAARPRPRIALQEPGEYERMKILTPPKDRTAEEMFAEGLKRSVNRAVMMNHDPSSGKKG